MDINKKILTSLAFAITFATPLFAQSNYDDEEDDEDDEVEVVTNGDDIDLPEGMETDVDSMLHLYNVQNYLQIDTTCNLPNFNPVYEKQTYIERLNALPTIIEMPYNEVVQKFIDRYSNNLRRKVSIMLGSSNFYMPIFEEALEMYQLPLELKYLPVIESSLNPNAVSRVGATGLWQFMLATGKRYDLEINSLIDERRDPIKASFAAAHYLSDLYRIYNDWELVIAAYNCGPEKVNKAIRRAGGVKDYWQIYPYLPRETRGYVPAFIAANYIMNYYCEHNICPMVTTLPSKTDTIMLSRDVHFAQIANNINITVEQLRELNPQYRKDIITGNYKLSSLRLPQTLINDFIDNEEAIYTYASDSLLTKRTEVEIPMVKITTSSKRSYKKRSKHNNSRQKKVTVRSGDTLSEIAKRNHTTVAKLRRLNGIRGNNIRVGKKIKVK